MKVSFISCLCLERNDENMQYVFVPYVNKPVSKIIYGTANSYFMEGEDRSCFADSILSTGINTFDTARVYKEAERTLGNWMQSRENRDDVVIISKCAHPTKSSRNRVNEYEIKKDLEASLQNLATDYIDIFLLHRDDLKIDVGTIIEVFNDIYYSGKIHSFGVSNWTYERIIEANEYAYKHDMIPLSVSSPNFSLAEQVEDPWGDNCITITGKSNKDSLGWYQKSQFPVIAYSSLAHGFLSGKFESNESADVSKYLDYAAIKGYAYPVNFQRLKRCERMAKQKGCTVPQIALAWVLYSKINVMPVVTTRSICRLKEDIAAFNTYLDESEISWLIEGSEI